MDKMFDSQATLALFLVFFIPGFISLKVYDLLVPSERRDFTKSMFDAVAYSALNFGFLLWLIMWLREGVLKGWQWYLGMFFLLIVVPAIWPILFFFVRRYPYLATRIASQNPRVWDDFFSARIPYWVIIHLKDGRRVGGLYAGKSYASHNPAPPEIYLEEVWYVNEQGGFTGARVQATSGVLVMGEQIQALEFFEYN